MEIQFLGVLVAVTSENWTGRADGRFRGSRGRVLLPTDFGGVMDFAQPVTWEGKVMEVESEDCRCYLLHGRPGTSQSTRESAFLRLPFIYLP